MAACGRLCLEKVFPVYVTLFVALKEGCQEQQDWGLFFEQNCSLSQPGSGEAASWTRLVSSLRPGPLPAMILGSGTWEEASDYFIAGFKAASGVWGKLACALIRQSLLWSVKSLESAALRVLQGSHQSWKNRYVSQRVCPGLLNSLALGRKE